MSVWRTEFDYLGGYDCIGHAYKIISPNGTTVCIIDFLDHEEDATGRRLSEEETHGRVKGFADLIVRALNTSEALR